MNEKADSTDQPNFTQSGAEIAAEYARLRNRLTELNSAPVKDMRGIDDVIDCLAKIQLALKATHGLNGNNPADN